jgi:PIN domain nuclease of toxin-antitoxin system
MTDLVLDTHAVLWYLNGSSRLSPTALDAIRTATAQGHRCLVSAITVVEAIYLVEKSRIAAAQLDILVEALADPRSNLQIAPLDFVVAQFLAKIPRVEVPDLPDRVIAATALSFGLPLITRDGNIRSSGVSTIW